MQDEQVAGTVTYGGDVVKAVGEYRQGVNSGFDSPPAKEDSPFFEAEHTMYWTEDYGSYKYQYTGTLMADGTFEGFYSGSQDHAALVTDINAEVDKAGYVKVTEVVCEMTEEGKAARAAAEA